MQNRQDLLMKKFLSLILAVVTVLGCLSGVTLAADPVSVTYTGGSTTCATAKALRTVLNNHGTDGKAVVTLLGDLDASNSALFGSDSNPLYPFTLNLNGHTISSTTGNCITVTKVSTAAGANTVMKILGPGTIVSYNRTVCMRAGSVDISGGVTLYSQQQYAVNLDI